MTLTPTTAPVRVGFLGAGLIATYHSKSLRRSGAAVSRAGVYDPHAERAAAFAAASGHTVYPSEDAVIADCDAATSSTFGHVLNPANSIRFPSSTHTRHRACAKWVSTVC